MPTYIKNTSPVSKHYISWHKYLLQVVRLNPASQNHRGVTHTLQKHTFFTNGNNCHNKEIVLPTITNSYSQCYPQSPSLFSLNH